VVSGREPLEIMGKSAESKKPRAELALVHASLLSGVQEAELIEYLNWSDASAGLKSALGIHLDRMRDGVHQVAFPKDPEDGIIRRLDMIARHRVIHRAMGMIGYHARTLTQAYTLALKPIYVVRAYGHWHSGVALAVCDDLEALVIACRDVQLGDPEQRKAAKALIHRLRVKVCKLFNDAVKAYLVAIQEARAQLVKPVEPRPVKRLEHICRVGSPIHKCPCGGEV
jgi:hypothetical protein